MNGTTDYTTCIAMNTNLSAAAIIRIAAIASTTPVWVDEQKYTIIT